MKRKFRDAAIALLDVQAKIKYLKDKEQEMAEKLQKLCDHQDMTVDGYTYKSHARKGFVAYSEIPELKMVNLDLYRSGPITIWKLSYQKQFEGLTYGNKTQTING